MWASILLKVSGKVGWSYVVRYDPRGIPVKYNHVDDEDNPKEEDDDDSYQEQVAAIDVFDEEV